MELNKFYKGLILQDGDYYDYVIYPIETLRTNIVCWVIPILPGTARKKTLPESEIMWSEYKPTSNQIKLSVEALANKGYIVDAPYEGCVYENFFIHKEEEIKNIYLKITKDGRRVLKKNNDLIVNSSSISSFVVQLFGEKPRFSVEEKRKSNFGEVFELTKIEQK